jgi:pentatricopeptide repeat protein
MSCLARCLQKLGRTEEAEQVWKTLIDRNPECYDYYRGLLSNHGISLGGDGLVLRLITANRFAPLDEITDENRDQALRIFREISDHLPQAVAPVRLSLTISSG